jgi:Cupin domain
MPGKVRRIVTAVNDQGRSYILSDIELPTGDIDPAHGVRAGLWLTDRARPSNAGTVDPAPDGVITQTPPQHVGGTVIRIADVLPDSVRKVDATEMQRRGAQTDPERSARHPNFHRTDTIDYAICLEGEVYAVMDEGETLMKAGDVLIQRGTYHAWSNRGDKIARMCYVLIDAEPMSGS